MLNPWLEIPLKDYESHMALASIAQAQYLSCVLSKIVKDVNPTSVAIIGCAGGNGFEELPSSVVRRVVGVDINPQYLVTTRRRYQKYFDQLELIHNDFSDSSCTFELVDLVYAGLVFEYVDYAKGMLSIKRFVKPGGYLSVVLQLPSETISEVSPSSYASLSKLSSTFKFVPVDKFEGCAKSHGFEVESSKQSELNSGKTFHEYLFRRKVMS